MDENREKRSTYHSMEASLCRKHPNLQPLETNRMHRGPTSSSKAAPPELGRMPTAEAAEHHAHEQSRPPYAFQPHTSRFKAGSSGAMFYGSPFGGWTHNNTIPSVIKISTQGSRVLHTRGTPAHTGDDIKGRNRNGRGNRDRIIGFKKKGHSQRQVDFSDHQKIRNATLIQNLENGGNKKHNSSIDVHLHSMLEMTT